MIQIEKQGRGSLRYRKRVVRKRIRKKANVAKVCDVSLDSNEKETESLTYFVLLDEFPRSEFSFSLASSVNVSSFRRVVVFEGFGDFDRLVVEIFLGDAKILLTRRVGSSDGDDR